jgi:hypothetical protein
LPFVGGLEGVSGWNLKGTPYLKAAAKASHLDGGKGDVAGVGPWPAAARNHHHLPLVWCFWFSSAGAAGAAPAASPNSNAKRIHGAKKQTPGRT